MVHPARRRLQCTAAKVAPSDRAGQCSGQQVELRGVAQRQELLGQLHQIGQQLSPPPRSTASHTSSGLARWPLRTPGAIDQRGRPACSRSGWPRCPKECARRCGWHRATSSQLPQRRRPAGQRQSAKGYRLAYTTTPTEQPATAAGPSCGAWRGRGSTRPCQQPCGPARNDQNGLTTTSTTIALRRAAPISSLKTRNQRSLRLIGHLLEACASATRQAW